MKLDSIGPGYWGVCGNLWALCHIVCYLTLRFLRHIRPRWVVAGIYPDELMCRTLQSHQIDTQSQDIFSPSMYSPLWGFAHLKTDLCSPKCPHWASILMATSPTVPNGIWVWSFHRFKFAIDICSHSHHEDERQRWEYWHEEERDPNRDEGTKAMSVLEWPGEHLWFETAKGLRYVTGRNVCEACLLSSWIWPTNLK